MIGRLTEMKKIRRVFFSKEHDKFFKGYPFPDGKDLFFFGILRSIYISFPENEESTIKFIDWMLEYDLRNRK